MSHHLSFARAAYYTLGCKLNFAETSTIAKLLAERGIHKIEPGEEPDICVVNTCSVTSMADKKCRHLIHSLSSRWPDATIVVTGCYAQLKPEEIIEMEGVDIVLGSNEKLKIASYLDEWVQNREKRIKAVMPAKDIREFSPSCERGDRTRYFLKVQDGCDYFCSYCTIPFARGRSRSATIDQLVEQARIVADEGGKEIILTGVNIGDFGKGRDDNFFDLIRALDEVNGISRYRISSIEPNLLSSEIIEWVAKESRAFMPHFHIPLQSGSDAVLKLMGRHYDTALFADRIHTIKELLPDAFIGVDVIAGARGESPEEWERSYEFIQSLPISRLHVFPYSERPGTRALNLGGAVNSQDKHNRVGMLTALSDKKLEAFTATQLGKVRPVLWERHHGGVCSGFTDNYLRVCVGEPLPEVNSITDAKLLSSEGETVTGELILK
jgi:threonylcarbamoyladenosine tRNA methylthiotransferase MtaB